MQRKTLRQTSPQRPTGSGSTGDGRLYAGCSKRRDGAGESAGDQADDRCSSDGGWPAGNERVTRGKPAAKHHVRVGVMRRRSSVPRSRRPGRRDTRSEPPLDRRLPLVKRSLPAGLYVSTPDWTTGQFASVCRRTPAQPAGIVVTDERYSKHRQSSDRRGSILHGSSPCPVTGSATVHHNQGSLPIVSTARSTAASTSSR